MGVTHVGVFIRGEGDCQVCVSCLWNLIAEYMAIWYCVATKIINMKNIQKK